MQSAQRAAFDPALARTHDPRRRIWRTFAKNQVATLGLALVLLIVAAALTAPWLAPHDPTAQAAAQRLAPPSPEYPFGRDDYGRDILSRVLYGARISLLVGVTSVLLGGILGTTLGVTAGFKGGKVENVIMRVVDVMLAFPDLITGVLVLAVLGAGLDKMIIAIGLVIAPSFARIAHGPTLVLREKDFVSAARSIGVGDLRMVGRHILPNISGELLVMASLYTAGAIRLEANLSFIGLGVTPPTPSWGQMIRDGTSHLMTAPYFSIYPGIAVLLTVLAFNLVGDGLRDILDPRLQS